MNQKAIVVGAKGFEPSTSWSRTKSLNPINALSGVAYGTRDLISPLLVVRNLYVNRATAKTNKWAYSEVIAPRSFGSPTPGTEVKVHERLPSMEIYKCLPSVAYRLPP